MREAFWNGEGAREKAQDIKSLGKQVFENVNLYLSTFC